MKYLCYDINGNDVSCWMHVKAETTANTIAGKKKAYVVDFRISRRGSKIVREEVYTIIYDAGIKGVELKVIEVSDDLEKGEIPDDLFVAMLDSENGSYALGAKEFADDELII